MGLENKYHGITRGFFDRAVAIALSARLLPFGEDDLEPCALNREPNEAVREHSALRIG